MKTMYKTSNVTYATSAHSFAALRASPGSRKYEKSSLRTAKRAQIDHMVRDPAQNSIFRRAQDENPTVGQRTWPDPGHVVLRVATNERAFLHISRRAPGHGTRRDLRKFATQRS